MWPQHAACGILVPRPGIEPAPSVVKTQNPKHLTPRGVPKTDVLIYLIIFDCISTLVAFLFPNQGSNPDPWQGECRALTTGPPGNSLSSSAALTAVVCSWCLGWAVGQHTSVHSSLLILQQAGPGFLTLRSQEVCLRTQALKVTQHYFRHTLLAKASLEASSDPRGNPLYLLTGGAAEYCASTPELRNSVLNERQQDDLCEPQFVFFFNSFIHSFLAGWVFIAAHMWAFSSCSEPGLLSSRSAQASHCGGFSCYRAWL